MGEDVPIVPDPTLLLSADEWCKVLPVPQIEGKYIFNYALVMEMKKIIGYLSRFLTNMIFLSILLMPNLTIDIIWKRNMVLNFINNQVLWLFRTDEKC